MGLYIMLLKYGNRNKGIKKNKRPFLKVSEEFNLWKIFTLESNQQKLPPPNRTINLPNSERNLNQNKMRGSWDRIKVTINHKIRLYSKRFIWSLVDRKYIWPLLLYRLGRVHFQFVLFEKLTLQMLFMASLKFS